MSLSAELDRDLAARLRHLAGNVLSTVNPRRSTCGKCDVWVRWAWVWPGSG